MAVLALITHCLRSRRVRLARVLARLACAFFISPAICHEARAQVGFVVNGRLEVAAATDANKSPPGFALPSQSADVKESLDEFERLAKHEQWEKAFQALEVIAGKTTTGFIDRGDGVLVPSRLLVRGLLAGLSGAGKNAYRLFYDSQATALWDKAEGAAELDNLNKIVNNHLISSVGDRAADRLGDLYFERGDYEQAAAAWQTLLLYCPDSKVSKAQLLIKVATALARSGRVGEFAAQQQTLRERYANDSVEIGGRRVSALGEMTRLAALAGSDKSAVAAASPLPEDFALPTDVAPLWQFTYQSKPDPTSSHQPFAIQDIYGRLRPNDFTIPAAVDDKRVYLNLFGVEMAFDAASGKLLWRSGKLHLLQFQQNRHNVMPERYSIFSTGDRTWSVLRDPQQANQGVGFGLVVRDAATGKEIFNSRRTLSAWSILGSPLLVAGQTPAEAAPPAVPSESPAPILNLANGFANSAGLFGFNGDSKLIGPAIRLTDAGNQKSSVFTHTPLDVTRFHTQFTIKLDKAQADGMTFALQGVGATALGNRGVNLGYGGLPKSVAVKFDLFNNGGEGANSTGLYLNGAEPNATNSVDLTGTGIDLHNGRPLQVTLDYDGTTLEASIHDTVDNKSATQSYTVNIPQVVGGPTAYVGFTASTGGLMAEQNVLSWVYTVGGPAKPKPNAADTVYIAASRTGQGRELALLALGAKDGKLQKTITLGNYAVDQNQVYGDRVAQPTLLMNGDRLYVDTHGGALVSLQPRSGTIDWGTLYDTATPSTGYYYDYQPPQLGISGPLRAGGLLFTKGMRSTRLLGLQAEGPTLAWNRPVSKTAVLIGADDERLYLGGEELTAYSLKTKELLWATQLPRAAGWSVPLLTQHRIYQFTSRGICEVDTATGEVLKIFRGADLDSFGGTMFLTPQSIVTVSNLAVTAYPRTPKNQQAQTP